MATTFTKIASITVGLGGTSSIDFTSIPQTYTDLVLKTSVRTGRGTVNDALAVKLNSSTTGYSSREVTYDNGNVPSYTDLFGAGYNLNTQGNGTTSNTFSNQEIYIPNYTGSAHKSFSSESVVENNGSDARVEIMASLWSNTSPITSIILSSYTGNGLLQHSTATLYGISNS
jgi:hypothetical protein